MALDPSIITGFQPGNPAQTMGSYLNLARGVQGYQTGQIQQQQAGTELQGQQIQLQQAQQANQERLALQDFTSKPENFMTNGRIDMDKINATVPKIAPLTGPEYMGKMSTLSSAQTQATTAKQNMTTAQRQLFAGPISVLGRQGVTDPAAYLSEIDNVVKENPGNSDIANLANAYKTIIPTVDPKKLPDTAIRASQGLMGPTEQQSALAPTAGALDTGQVVRQTTAQPSVGAQPPSITAGAPIAEKQMPVGSQYFDTSSNRTMVVSGAGRSMPAGAILGQPEAIGGTVGTINRDWDQTVASASNAQRDIGILQTIKQLAPAAATGPGADRRLLIDKLAGALGMQSKQMQATATDELAKNQNMLALAGGNTDAARMLAEVANPNWHMTKDAIAGTADQLISQRSAAVAKQKYLAPAKAAADAGHPEGYVAGLQRWSEMGDPRVFQYQHMTGDEKTKLKQSMKPADQAAFGAKLKQLQGAGLLE
jgi:hypothetical protein